MVAPVPDRSRKLLAINAFYQSDQIDRSVTVLMEGKDLWPLADFICGHITDFKTKSVSISDVKRFLADVRRDEPGNDSTKVMTAAVIGYLEEIGAIPSDEYNGLQYVYEPRVETNYVKIDSPVPELDMYRDLPRRSGFFYLVLEWTDLEGRAAKHKIARQASATNVEEAHDQFQTFLDDQYQDECKLGGTQIDREEFIINMIPVAAQRAVELLNEAKSENDLRIDAPIGRFACFLACWIIWQLPFQHEITNPALLTLAFHIRFQDGQFRPLLIADHGEGPKPVTLH